MPQGFNAMDSRAGVGGWEVLSPLDKTSNAVVPWRPPLWRQAFLRAYEGPLVGRLVSKLDEGRALAIGAEDTFNNLDR